MRGTRAKQISRFAKQISNGAETLVEGKVIRRPVFQDGQFVIKDGKPLISETVVREFTKNSFKPLCKAAKRGWNATGTEDGMVQKAFDNLRSLDK